MINGSKVKVMSSHNGVPCYEMADAVTLVNGIGAANISDNVPACSLLRQNAVVQANMDSVQSAKFDPLTWIKENKLIAAGIAAAAYFFLKK